MFKIIKDGTSLGMTEAPTYVPVSYTHLDVYKRQRVFSPLF